jgi:ribosome biogenesis GTPase
LKHFDEEEHFHSKDWKEFRKERKLAQKLDRSKFKKTDKTVILEKKTDEPLSRGKVLSIFKEGILVDLKTKQILCPMKGVLKKEVTQAKNVIAVGDWVQVTDAGAIHAIEPRTSILSRSDISGRKEQLVAVNVDQIIVSASILNPPFKPALIDRYLIAAEKGNIHPIIVINKIDLLEDAPEEEKTRYEEFLKAYEPLGIPILSVSAKTQVGIEALKSLLQDKTSVFAGQSGIGKSSLLNICFDFNQKVGELAVKTSKGAHTTSSATLLMLPEGGYCVDTPGIRSFSLWKLEKEDIISHFSEFFPFIPHCKYPDCSHRREPSCAVLKAIEEEKISPLRYESYLTLMEEIESGAIGKTWS